MLKRVLVCSLFIGFAAPLANAEALIEQPLLDAFKKLEVMHVDFEQVFDRHGSRATLKGTMLFVNDGADAQFHLPIAVSFDDNEDAAREVEYLYQAGILHVTDHHPESLSVRKSYLDPTELTPPGGPLLFEKLRASYDLERKSGDGKDENQTIILGTLKSGAEPKLPYQDFEARFDSKTGVLQEMSWENGPGSSAAKVYYRDADLDPDWDPVRLVFDPPVGAIVDEEPR